MNHHTTEEILDDLASRAQAAILKAVDDNREGKTWDQVAVDLARTLDQCTNMARFAKDEMRGEPMPEDLGSTL